MDYITQVNANENIIMKINSCEGLAHIMEHSKPKK